MKPNALPNNVQQLHADEHEWLEEAERRAYGLLTSAEQALSKDLSWPIGILGAGMIVVGCLLMIFGIAFAFSLTVMVWGSILAVVAAVLRNKTVKARVEALRVAQAALDGVQSRRLRLQALERICADGLPATWSSADVVLLIGTDRLVA